MEQGPYAPEDEDEETEDFLTVEEESAQPSLDDLLPQDTQDTFYTPPSYRETLPPGMTPALRDAFIKQESGGNPLARGASGEYGLMQVMPINWQKYGGGDWTDPEENKRVGMNLYSDEYTRFSGNTGLSIAAYNAGSPAVISALEQAGYSLKDAAYVSYDAVKPFLSPKVQDYVQSVTSYARDFANTNTSPGASTPLELVGTEKNLADDLSKLAASKSFDTMSARERLSAINEVYGSRKKWTPEADILLKDIASTVWDGALPNEQPNYRDLLGTPPRLEPEENGEEALSKWKEETLRQLKDTGLNPLLYGKGVDDYFEQASRAELEQRYFRNRDWLDRAVDQTGAFFDNWTGTARSAVSSVWTAPLKLLGYKQLSERLDLGKYSVFGAREKLPTDFFFQIDEEGKIKTDEYGQPLTNLSASVSSALGSLSGTLLLGGGAAGLGLKGLSLHSTFLGTFALQNGAAAYDEALQNGASREDGLKAFMYSLPATGAEYLAGMAVFGGGPYWIKGLTKANLRRAGAKVLAEKAVLGAGIAAGGQGLRDVATSLAIEKDVTSADKLTGAALAGGMFGAVSGLFTPLRTGPKVEVLPREPLRGVSGEIRPQGDVSIRPGQALLEGPAPRQMLPEGIARPLVTGPVAGTPQLPAPLIPKASGPIEQGGRVTGFDLPSAEEHIRLAQEFEALQASPESQKILTIRSPADVDQALLEHMGLRGEIRPDGTLHVVEESTYVPAEIKNLTPEGIDSRIETLARELGRLPTQDDMEALTNLRRDYMKELSGIDAEAKAQAPVVAQFEALKDELTQNITRWKRDLLKPDTNKQLLRSRLAEARQELAEIKDYLNAHKLPAYAATLKQGLRDVQNALQELEPLNLNNRKQKTRELENLLLTKAVGEGEFKAKKVEESRAAERIKEQNENLKRGYGIETKKGTRYILPFENKWYVLDETGRPLTKGLSNIVDATDVARGIIDSETAHAFVSGVQPVTKQPIQKPYRFKQRIEVPWYVVTATKPEAAPKAALKVKRGTGATKKFKPLAEEKLSAAKKKAAKPPAREEAPQAITKKTRKEVLEEAEPSGPPVRSKTTGHTFSKSISPELRNITNYWLSGFGAPETIVGTFGAYNRGELKDVLSPKQIEVIERAKAAGKFETAGGVSDFIGGKGFILLREGGTDYQAARDASHEVGHVFLRDKWDALPKEIRNAIFKDFTKFRGDLALTDTADKWAATLLGPDTAWEGDTTPFSELSAKDQWYIASEDQGFEEFLANQVSEFALNPDKKAGKGAPSFYKTIADAFRDIWNRLKSVFKISEPFQEWLNKQFDVGRGRRFERGQDRTTEPGGTERKFSKRVRESETVAEEVRAGVGKQTYRPQSSKEMAQKMRARIEPSNIDKNIREVTDFENDMPYQERIVYGIEVMNELGRQINDAKKAGKDITSLIDREADLVKSMAEEGTELGRGVQAFSLFSSMSYDGMLNRFTKDLREMLGVKDAELSKDLKEKLRDVYDRMQAVKSTDLNADISENVILSTLGQEAVNLVSKEIPRPLTSALSYYWYGDMMSGLSTQTINAFGSGMSLFGKSAATALTMPGGFTTFLSGLAKGVPKGIAGFKGAMRGRVQAKGQKFGTFLRSTTPPITPDFENKLAQALIKKPVDFFNKQLETVFRLMNAFDAFFYYDSSEGQAYLAARRALQSEGVTGSNLPSRIAEELHNSTTEFETARAQAQKEWEASGTKFDDKDVTLRAYEIIDARRAPEIREKSRRFGLVSTYNERPAGLFGALADTLNAGIRQIAPLRIQFPFVNVVSNVLSQSLDYSPVGIIRAAAGRHINDILNTTLRGKSRGEKFNPEERLQRLGSGIWGTALLAGVWAIAEQYLDDPDPQFAVYARGPKNKGEAETWKNSGAKPYSLKIGKTYIRFAETPLAPIMAWLGELHDAYRYSPSFNKKSPGDKFTYSLARVGGVVLDMGFLRGISTLWDTLHGDRDPKELIIGPAKSLVPFSGLLRDIAKTTDDFELDPKAGTSSFLRGLPFIQGYAGKPALNAFGEPIKVHNFFDGVPLISQLVTPVVGRFVSERSDDPRWNFLAEKGVYIPSMSSQASVGVSSPTGAQKGKIERLKKERAETLGRAAYDTLTYEEIYEITKLAGPDISKGVERLMDKNLKTEKLQDEIQKITEAARRKAKIKYFGY